MKKKNISLISVLFIAVSTFIILAVYLLSVIEKVPGDQVAVSSINTESEQNMDIQSQQENDFYIIKTTEDGKIGVYKGDAQEPTILLHEIMLKALPKFDRDLLAKGITIYSDEELYKIIEDFDG